MQITITLSDELAAELQKMAVESRRTLTQVVEDALRESLESSQAWRPYRREISLPTFGNGGVLPGVDISNNAALLDIMESGFGIDRLGR